MTDKDKTLVEEPKVEDKPVDVKPTEEPKVEESDSSAAASTDDAATPAGTDQQGRQLYSVKCSNCRKTN